jgi:undecaprenyl-diphosphatase
MNFFQALILGVLQGATEFLPVSSSGHLALMKHFFELTEVPLLFDVILHIATLVVVLLFFRKRVAKLLLALAHLVRGKRSEEDKIQLRLILVILLATFFTGVIGLGLEGLEVGSYPRLVSSLLIVTGIILILARTWSGNVDYGSIGLKQGLITGIAQGLGVLPGISRSGITISAALLSGMDREKAGEFSFLISLPAIAGALLLELRHLNDLFASVSPSMVLVGFISAFATGMVSLSLLLSLVRKGRLYYFSFYLIPAGILGIILL